MLKDTWHFLTFVCTESDGSGSEMTPDQEARHVVKKIRRHVRLMNRKWVELNQHSNEWQHRIEAVLEVIEKQFLNYIFKFNVIHISQNCDMEDEKKTSVFVTCNFHLITW